ncbi:uncharacterized protein LOC106151906 [Lingula anatina]|uniref:chitin synthase n=1 Tax=Lingula anatina TaxID=7574 RepID=A0A1S3H3T5_LINAN|nr:uncharacterized protein LOC106151906 [Lingula anatina]|eukprot:XP_013380800.1 uncharacterized protein LOC106151906 [Lingula anatina]
MAASQGYNRFDLTVSEGLYQDNGDSKTNPSRGAFATCVSITKYIVSIIVMLCILFCLVSSKIAVIAIAQNFNPSRPDTMNLSDLAGSDNFNLTSHSALSAEKQISLLMLLIIFIVPYGFSLLRCFWVGGFSCTIAGSGKKPWPSGTGVLLGFLSSAFEVTGLWLSCLILFPYINGFLCVLISTGVFVWPNIWNAIEPLLAKCLKSRQMQEYTQRLHLDDDNDGTGSIGFTIYNIVVALVSVVGLILLSVADIAGELGSKTWAIPISVLLLSFAWWPTLLKHQLLRSDQYQEDPEDALGRTRDRYGHKKPYKLVRWKSGILTSLWKLGLTPFILWVTGRAYLDTDDFIKLMWGQNAKDTALLFRNHPCFPYFLVNVITSFAGYLFTWFADAIDAGFDIKRKLFSAITLETYLSLFFIPLALATPIAALVVGEYSICSALLADFECRSLTPGELGYGIPVIILLFTVNLFSVGRYIFTNKTLVLSKESQLFWIPCYNGVLLEQWLWLNRKTYKTDPDTETPDKAKQRCTVYMNTTMYNESAEEMSQLLGSIKNVRDNRSETSPKFHSHIWLDGAFDTKRKGDNLGSNALRLITLLKEVFDIELRHESFEFRKSRTSYGMRLSWQFPLSPGKQQKVRELKNEDPKDYVMSFTVHLKDNRKVKNKKRWSQIMYLSMIVDYLTGKPRPGSSSPDALKKWTQTLQDTFILATDADVKFNCDSVEALLDVMIRDDSKNVSAVCGRTQPLGSKVQPIVSYQVFDYAIGHWLQKCANHMLGSVLCAPGCFSLYRTSVLRKVVAEYGSNTNGGFEFLCKDMGEDRWLCTLMVKQGNHLEYTGAAEDKTFCPETFEEFFKQRRRWIVSTIANMWLLLSDYGSICAKNERISRPFILYQAFLMVSTLIGPATVILVVAGGLQYSYGVNDIALAMVFVAISVFYLVVCLFTKHDTQIMLAIVLSAAFALVMAAAFIGTIRQLVSEYGDLGTILATETDNPWELPIPVSSLYITAITGMFIITAALHPTEFFDVVHGLTYLFFLPAGYLFLTIYSICNITDQSWGTREGKKAGPGGGSTWESIMAFFKSCCCPRPPVPQVETATVKDESSDERTSNYSTISRESKRSSKGRPMTVILEDEDSSDDEEQDPSTEEKINAKDWLYSQFYQGEIKACASYFVKLGYGDTTFIAGMGREEVRSVGIVKEDHIDDALAEIARLPAFEIDPWLPQTDEEKLLWIKKVGLMDYKKPLLEKFDDLPKTTELSKLRIKYGIHKPGHLKRLYYVIQKLREPTEAESRSMEVRQEVAEYQDTPLSNDESAFWQQLVEARLKPEPMFKEKKRELESELVDLRKTALMWFAVVNTLWLTIFLTLGSLGRTDPTKPNLYVFGNNPLGLVFLFIFCILLIIQFFAMLAHRLLTFVHIIARAKFDCGKRPDDDVTSSNRQTVQMEEVDYAEITR